MSRLRASPHTDEGFTLVELMISMVLASLVAVVVYHVITGFFTIDAVTLSAQQATSEANLGTAEVSRVLGDAINLGSGALLEASPSAIRFDALDQSGALGVQSVWVGSGPCPCQIYTSFATGTATPAPTALGVTVASPNVFAFYSAPQSASDLAGSSVSVPTTGTTDPTTLSGIALIDVRIVESIVDRGTASDSILVHLPAAVQEPSS
jgi:prepilin-type N-terminal cleavage/methylation domain-containing protein